MNNTRIRRATLVTFAWTLPLVAIGCTDGPSDSGETSGSATTGATGSNGDSSTSGTGTSSDTSSTTDTMFDLTAGDPTTEGDPTMMPSTDGGTLPLTSEEITAIKAGECSALIADATPVPPVLELVVDVSNSMNEPAPGQPAGGSSRWDLARDALLAAIESLPDGVAVGLQFFPTANPAQGGGRPGGGGMQEAECVGESGRVAIAPLGAPMSAQRTALETAMNRTNRYNGTPTHDGYRNGLEQGLKMYDGPGDRFMLLMTDGAPTQDLECTGDPITAVDGAPVLAEVQAAAAEGIATFVIGSPGSEDTLNTDMRPFLSSLALAGGTGPDGCTVDGPQFCHFDMTQSTDFSAALAEGLASIADQASTTCLFVAPEGGDIDLSETSVIIERSDGSAVLVLNDAEGDCSEGWKWNAAGDIELCAATCASVESDPGARVSVSLGCQELIH